MKWYSGTADHCTKGFILYSYGSLHIGMQSSLWLLDPVLSSQSLSFQMAFEVSSGWQNHWKMASYITRFCKLIYGNSHIRIVQLACNLLQIYLFWLLLLAVWWLVLWSQTLTRIRVWLWLRKTMWWQSVKEGLGLVDNVLNWQLHTGGVYGGALVEPIASHWLPLKVGGLGPRVYKAP